MSKAIVRRADERDAEAITALLLRAFAEFEQCYSPEAFAATTPPVGEIVRRLKAWPAWVAFESDTVVGTLSALPRDSHGTAVLTMARFLSPEWRRGNFVMSTDLGRLDRTLVHAFLTKSYWARSIPLALVERSIEHSLAFGVYDDGVQQVGFAR